MGLSRPQGDEDLTCERQVCYPLYYNTPTFFFPDLSWLFGRESAVWRTSSVTNRTRNPSLGPSKSSFLKRWCWGLIIMDIIVKTKTSWHPRVYGVDAEFLRNFPLEACALLVCLWDPWCPLQLVLLIRGTKRSTGHWITEEFEPELEDRVHTSKSFSHVLVQASNFIIHGSTGCEVGELELHSLQWIQVLWNTVRMQKGILKFGVPSVTQVEQVAFSRRYSKGRVL